MKVAKGVNLKSSHHKKEKRNFVTLYGMVGNQIYCPDHFAVYTNHKSLCWTPKNTWIKKEKLIKPLHLITVTILWNNCNFLRKKKQFYFILLKLYSVCFFSCFIVLDKFPEWGWKGMVRRDFISFIWFHFLYTQRKDCWIFWPIYI